MVLQQIGFNYINEGSWKGRREGQGPGNRVEKRKGLAFGVKQCLIAPTSPELLPGLRHLPQGRGIPVNGPMVTQGLCWSWLTGYNSSVLLCLPFIPVRQGAQLRDALAPSAAWAGGSPVTPQLLKKGQDVPIGIRFPWDIRARTWLGCN